MLFAQNVGASCSTVRCSKQYVFNQFVEAGIGLGFIQPIYTLKSEVRGELTALLAVRLMVTAVYHTNILLYVANLHPKPKPIRHIQTLVGVTALVPLVS